MRCKQYRIIKIFVLRFLREQKPQYNQHAAIFAVTGSFKTITAEATVSTGTA